MDNIEHKLDKMQEDLTEIKVTLALNTEHLAQHMERTALAERKLDLLEQTLAPIQNHVLLVNYTIALIGALFTAALTLYGVYEAIQALRN